MDFSGDESILLQKTIEEKKKELQSVSGSFLWLWVHCETQEEKDEIIKKFINQTNQQR
jgi:Mg2+ and Co2+ transporter CorA